MVNNVLCEGGFGWASWRVDKCLKDIKPMCETCVKNRKG